MKITLIDNHTDKRRRLDEIKSELSALDEKLKMPSRTLDDIVRHIQLLNEMHRLL